MLEKVPQSHVDRINTILDFKIWKDIYNRIYFVNLNVPKEELMILMGVRWSDAFDPNSSIKAIMGEV